MIKLSTDNVNPLGLNTVKASELGIDFKAITPAPIVAPEEDKPLSESTIKSSELGLTLSDMGVIPFSDPSAITQESMQSEFLQQPAENIPAYEGIWNAMLTSLYAQPVSMYKEMVQGHEESQRFIQGFVGDHPRNYTTMEIGAEIFGNVIPSAIAIIATIFPETVTTAVGVTYLTHIGAQAAGNTLRKVREEELKTGVPISDMITATAMIGNVAVEILIERVSLGLQTGLAGYKAIKVVGKGAPSVVKKATAASIERNSFKFGEEFGTALLTGSTSKAAQVLVRGGIITAEMGAIEGIEEGTTQFGQNIFDNIFMSVPILKGTFQSMGYGSVGGLMLGPLAGGVRYKQLGHMGPSGNPNLMEKLLTRSNINYEDPTFIGASEKIYNATKHVKGMTQDQANDITAILAGYADYQDIPLKDAMAQYFTDIVQNDVEGDLQQYIGQKAENFDLISYTKAIVLDKLGESPDKIFFMTGNFKDIDGNWQQEIDFKDVNYTNKGKSLLKLITNAPHRYNQSILLSQLLTYDKLFEAYPALRDATVSITKTDEDIITYGTFEAGHYLTTGKYHINLVTNTGDIRSALLHEVQHGIQRTEGYSYLSSVEAVSTRILAEDTNKIKALYNELNAKGLDKGILKELLTVEGIDAILNMNNKGRRMLTMIRQVSNESGTDYFRAFDEAYAEIYQYYLDARVEIDPRDVEARSNMSPEELQKTLPKAVQIALAGDSKKHLYQQSMGEALGSVQFAEDGKAIINIFKNANMSTIYHELAHVFRRHLKSEDLDILEDIYGVKDWKSPEGIEAEEAFAKGFERWLRTGTTENPRLLTPMKKFKKWLTSVYKRIKGSALDIGMHPDIKGVFDRMLGAEVTFQDIMEEHVSRWAALIAFKRNYLANLTDVFDIEAAGKRIGKPETFFQMRIFASTLNGVITDGMALVTNLIDVFKDIKSTKGRLDKMRDALITFENDKFPDEEFTPREQAKKDLSPEDYAKMESAWKLIDDFFTGHLNELKKRGILKEGFVESEIRHIKKEIGVLLKDIDTKNISMKDLSFLEKAKDKLDRLSDLHYTHIPINALFNKYVKRNSARISKFLKYLVTHERRTISIRSMLIHTENGRQRGVIPPEEFNPIDVIMSYVNIVGRDLAISNVVEAAKKEELSIDASEMTKGEKKKLMLEGYSPAPFTAVVFKGFLSHKVINNWISEVTMYRHDYYKIDKFINYVKMHQFIDFTFLMLYNLIQGGMAGVISPWSPRWYKNIFAKSIHDVWSYSENFREARSNGMSSQPFRVPYIDQKVVTETILHPGNVNSKNPDIRALLGLVHRTIRHPLSIINNIYQASWKLAWTFGDETIRMMHYNYLKSKGFTSREAAEGASMYHSQYDSVPRPTVKWLNRVAFTPTFKITMGKLFYNMIKSGIKIPVHFIGKPFGLKSTLTKQDKHYGTGMYRTMGIMFALSMLMSAMGYKEDEWGRRYVKTVDTDEGPKENVITFAAPFNMFLKYYYRWRAAFGPNVDNPFTKFLSTMSWELTPSIQMITGLITNQDSMGRPIYPIFASTELKASYALKYSISKIYALFKWVGEEYEDDKKARDIFRQETKKWMTATYALQPITFAYLRMIPEEAVKYSLIRRHRELTTDIQRAIDKAADGYLDPEVLEMYMENYMKRVDEIIKELEEYN